MTIQAILTGNTALVTGTPMSISLDDGTYFHGKKSGYIPPKLTWYINAYPLCCALLHIQGFSMQGAITPNDAIATVSLGGWGRRPEESGQKFFGFLEADRDRLVAEIKKGFEPVAAGLKHYGGITGVIAYHNKAERPWYDKFMELLCEILDVKFEQAMVVRSNHNDYPCIQFNAVTRQYDGPIISEILPMTLKKAS